MRTSFLVRYAAPVFALSVTVARLGAQCPDGGPAPCKAAATPRRDPPIDDRTWLVLPFENSAHVQDADLISQASVTLLTQELGRWKDVRVIPDDRVPDLLRQLPEAQRRSPGLEASLRLARSVGAGRVIVGSFLAVSGRANVAAKVYDVRSGNQLRTTNDRLNGYTSDAGLDSLTSVFGRLGRAVLDVQSGRESGGLGGVGTSSVAAYKEYVQGLAAFSRWRIDSAAIRFRSALAIDSTFALAHLYLGRSLLGLGDAIGGAAELDAAGRFVEGLSPHARLVIASVRGRSESLCATAGELLRADSSDVAGWTARARCLMQSQVQLANNGPRWMYRDRNAAIRANSRALELDPGNVDTFAQLVSSLIPVGNGGCVADDSEAVAICANDRYYRAVPLVMGDSIVETPRRYSDNPFASEFMTREAAASRRILLMRARDIAERWTSANPSQFLGHYWFGYVLLGLGDLAGAERELIASKVAAQIPQARRFYYRDRVELALRAERFKEAEALLDSMFLDATAAQQPPFQTLFGRFSADRNAVDTPDIAVPRSTFMQLYAGVVPPHVDSMVLRVADLNAARHPVGARASSRQNLIALASLIGFHMRGTGPALDTASVSPLGRYQSFFARSDTARARRELATYDALVNSSPEDSFDGGQLFSAESHLELGDSTEALTQMQKFVAIWPRFWMNPNTNLASSYAGVGTSPLRLGGRAWLLYADLSAARGLREEAKRGYRNVIALWEHGEPPVQPMVARARAALAQLDK